MDIASVVGLVLAFGLIVGSILIGTAPFTAFIDYPSILIVFGGSVAALMVCFPLRTFLKTPLVIKKVFLNKPPNLTQLIEQLVSLAETARRDGLLALEGRLDEVNNSFIRLGVQMAVDGTRPEVLEDILRSEVESVAARHKDGKNLLDQMGKFCPAFGMIGTLMGLIMMLSNMQDPSSIGSGMAVALITTLYGAVASNAIFLPFAEKLSFINKQELVGFEIIMRGILAIQAGENPRVVEQKLNTYLPAKLRTTGRKAA